MGWVTLSLAGSSPHFVTRLPVGTIIPILQRAN